MNKIIHLKEVVAFILFVIIINSSLNAQVLSTYNETINLSGSDISVIKGMNITITNAWDKLEDEYRFYTEIPDTLWIKKVRKPKLDKHYRLYYTYKTLGHIEKGEYTDSKDIVNRIFTIVDVETVRNGEYYSSSLTHTIKLQDVITNEIIFMDLKNVGKISLEFKIQNPNILDKLKGEIFVSSDGKKETIKDCYYEYCRNSNYDDWELRYSSIKNLTIEFESGETIDAKYATSYLTIEEYEIEQYKKIEESANKGEYRVVLSEVIKPKSSKFTEGKVLNEQSYYGDNIISIIINVMESGFKFYLSNNSQNTIKINWDDAIYVNEHGFSDRVIHSGVRYIDANKPQQASLIAQNATISDIIVPVDCIYRTYDYEWNLHPLFYMLDVYRSYDNRQVKIILPVEINNVSYEYTFIFEFVWEWTYPNIREEWLKNQEETNK